MKQILHLVINEDNLDKSSMSEKFSERLDRSKIEYIQVKDLDQFDRLVECLREDLLVQIWVHPNNAYRRSHNLNSTAEQDIAIALKARKNVKFNLVTRVIDEEMRAFADEIGVRVFKASDIWRQNGKVGVQTVANLKGIKSRISGKGLTQQIDKETIKVDFAIITALYDKEFEMVEEFVEKLKPVKGFDTLMIGNLKKSNKRVLVDFQVQMGMVDCAILSTQIIERFKPKYLILCGVCGGRKSKGVKLLDLLIPNKVFEYHTGKYVRGKVNPYLRSANIISNKIAVRSSKQIIESIKNYVDPPTRELIADISVHTKSMACGNWVVKGNLLEKELAKKDEEVVGLEMESYGIATAGEVLKSHGVNILVIKSVMDLTDVKKNDKKKSQAAFISACFTYFLIKDFL